MKLDVVAAPMLVTAIAIGFLSGCTKSAPATAAERGRQDYLTYCIQCHNPDPTQPGSQGPALAGSSRELLEDRVLRLTYPPGYKPKRNTHTMLAMPQLAPKIDDLAAYLSQAGKDQGQ
ncbi:MAG TPA: c-type cytochrome [Candidatus Binataceae bacterium]|nr:c-type cytochrome [Candidatus Binataceae bacterium]